MPPPPIFVFFIDRGKDARKTRRENGSALSSGTKKTKHPFAHICASFRDMVYPEPRWEWPHASFGFPCQMQDTSVQTSANSVRSKS